MKCHRIQQGAALLEFAFVLPVLMMMVTGLLTFGMALNSWLTISNAAREGARAAAVGKTNAQIETIVRDKAAALIQDNLEVTITPASQADRVEGGILQVRVRYFFPLTTPVYDVVLPNPMTLTSACSMQIETVGS